MKITFFGSRGSIPCLEPETVRYGGNTVCVEVRGSDGSLLVLDAGTGIKGLSAGLTSEISHVDILLTHLHMDHIQGLGFFGPLDSPDKRVNIWGPPSITMNLRSCLARYLSPPLFPIHLSELQCHLTIKDVPRGKFRIGDLEIVSDFVCHPGPTVGYRIKDGNRTLAYLPDHEPALGVRSFPEDPEWTSGFGIASGADVLIHDAQYNEEEYPGRVGWGHSSIMQAVAFAKAAQVGTLYTFHHDPSHYDDMLDALLLEAQGASDISFPLKGGVEGDSFMLV